MAKQMTVDVPITKEMLDKIKVLVNNVTKHGMATQTMEELLTTCFIQGMQTGVSMYPADPRKVPIWEKKLPVEPGWYWMWNMKRDQSPRVTNIRWYGGKLCIDNWGIESEKNTLWWGPLPVPVIKKEK